MGKDAKIIQDSKYDGFGNSPIYKTDITDTIRNVVEQVLNTPDPRLERLEACLKSSRGKYQAARVDLELSEIHEDQTRTRQEPRKHIPGRAGGGWEDEDSEDEFVEFGGLCLESKDEDDKLGLITATDEFVKIRQFCMDEPLPVDLDILNSLVQELKMSEKLNILFSLKHVLETESDENILRALLLTEKILEQGLITANVLLTVLKTNLELRKVDENRKISVKSSKILATLEYLLSPWLVYSGPKLLYLHLPILPLDLNLGYLLSPWLVYSGHKLHFPILPLDLMYSPNSNTRFFLIFATSA
ncbi:uncharacterized protein LOC111710404 [Eurytemora carolleeae]|uniref:uncharacterized protein LOC111710404 n=1 Tax=Eurytemora carolleeae TaxID=1294199 RepID=UPI000C77C5B8|nr:uncharacterized protein LOC111710404 [Eurytemora carolleeae]|eukprot:XP_023340252.1 uncharacterized protein LOC111710404 [Eurytemora affinis]